MAVERGALDERSADLADHPPAAKAPLHPVAALEALGHRRDNPAV
jgi:hypothetical protein